MVKSEQSEINSYLGRLKFDPALMQSWVGRYIQSIRLVFLLILTIVLVGTLSYINLPKRLNPEVKIPIITIVSVLPGASPSDVETLVTTPLEDKLRGLQGIDQVSSVSQQNVSFITLQFVSTVDREKAKEDVTTAIEPVQLPANAVDPEVRALDFEDVPIWQFALTSTGDVPDLMAASEALKNRIEDISKVDRVETTGIQTQEVVVYINPEKLGQYNINPAQLSQAVKTARSSFPAGTIQSESNTFTLTIDRTLETVQDIRDLKLTINGQSVTLGEVAIVQEQAKLNQQQTLLGKPGEKTRQAVVFSVYKTSSSDITAAGNDVEKSVEEFIAERNNTLQTTTLLNTSEEISKQFTDLLGEFTTTIILVFAVLLIFLGLRQALISSLTVPLTFLSAFFLMQLTGMTINFLSLFAFLLSLGLLVDDTIVVVSAMTTYFRSGRFTPAETGVLVWRDTIVPIWSTTITTIWAFVPLLLASGIIGEFIKPIPIVVTVTMISSTAIAVLITLPLMILILKPVIPVRVIWLLKALVYCIALGVVIALAFGTPLFIPILLVYVILSFIFLRTLPSLRTGSRAALSRMKAALQERFPRRKSGTFSFIQKIVDKGIIDIEPFAEKYERLIDRILQSKTSRRKVMWAVAIYAIFSFALLPLGFVKNEFFPKTDENQVFVELKLPSGTDLAQTKTEGTAILGELLKIPEAEYITAEIGKRANTDGGSSALSASTNSVYYTVRLVDKEERKISSPEIATQLRDTFANYTAGDISVVEVSGGPPAGSDLQITLLGNDLREMEQIADTVVAYLKEQPGVTNINKSVDESTSAIQFVPDEAKLAEYGVGKDEISSSLRLYASGFPLDSIAFEEGDSDKKDIVFRVTEATGSPQGLSELRIFTKDNKEFPLLSLGKLVTKANPTVIAHRNFKRSISVSAAVTTGTSIPDTNKKLLEFTDSIKLPQGYEWETGGVNEENAKSIQSILMAMILSAVLILITMVIQFNSFRQALIVIIVIPLAVSSVFLAFAITGTPLSFPALIGVLSLFGIIVTNSMFIVDKINLNKKEGMSFRHSIANAGASRLEPIILTKLSTVFGLLPITIADPLWRGLGGAIISGLLVASTIMLLFIPVLYFEWMKED
jgi:multidrug efflux pump subunit AcrB